MYEKTFDKLFVTNESIGKDTLKKLMNMNKDTQNNSLFQSPQIKWRSEAGAKAIKKFTDMVLKNDMKKLEYYKNCLKVPALGIHINNAPFPIQSKHSIIHIPENTRNQFHSYFHISLLKTILLIFME